MTEIEAVSIINGAAIRLAFIHHKYAIRILDTEKQIKKKKIKEASEVAKLLERVKLARELLEKK